MGREKEFFEKYWRNVRVSRNIKILGEYKSSIVLPSKVYKALDETIKDLERLNENNVRLKNKIEKMEKLNWE